MPEADIAPRKRLVAILAADAVGYSRLMSQNEFATIAALDQARAVFRDAIARHSGRIVDMAGDSVLALFESAAGALTAARTVQAALAQAAQGLPDDRRMPFRIGLHLGDVIEKDDGSAYGDGINVAARLQSIAPPGELVASEAIVTAVRNTVSVDWHDLGDQTLKNLRQAIHAFATGLATSAEVPSPVDSHKPSLAVVRFTNLSGDPSQDYFVEGLTEDLATDLSRLRWLFVIGAKPSQDQSGTRPEAREVGRKLGVRYALDGSVRRTAERLRVSARLVDVASGAQLWSERYDRPFEEVFALQDELVRAICANVGLSVPQAELARARKQQPARLDAWDLYLLAQPALRETTEAGFKRAIGHLMRALEMDPEFASARARLALAYIRAGYYGWNGLRGSEAHRIAKEHALTALGQDPSNALALDALASVHLYFSELDAAASTARRAIEIDPSITAAHGTLVNSLAFMGRADEAISAYERCLPRLAANDPDRSGALMGYVNALFVAGRYQDAILAGQAHVELRPDWVGNHVMLAASFGQLTQLADARREVAQILRLVPSFNLQTMKRRPFFKRPEDLEPVIEGLRRAGLPSG